MIAVGSVLSLIYAFSEKGLNLAERVQKLMQKRQRREDQIEDVVKQMDKMLENMHRINDQWKEAAINAKHQLENFARMQKQIEKNEQDIEQLQKEIAYIRGKTDKP